MANTSNKINATLCYANKICLKVAKSYNKSELSKTNRVVYLKFIFAMINLRYHLNVSSDFIPND